MCKNSGVLVRFSLLLIICCKSLIACGDFDYEALSKLNFQSTTLKDWRVTGHFAVQDNLQTGTCHYDLEFVSISDHNLIKNIVLTNSNFTTSKPRISFTFNDKYQEYLGNKINNNCYNLICDSPEHIQDFLRKFYHLNAIPNFIIDRISNLPEFSIKNFESNTIRLKIDQ